MKSDNFTDFAHIKSLLKAVRQKGNSQKSNNCKDFFLINTYYCDKIQF